MELVISGKNFKVAEDLRDHVDRRLQFALGKFDPEIDRVEVGLSDVNGPKGGIDKQCRIVARTRSLGTVVVEDADGDFYTVVSRAADRIAHSVAKTLDRKRNGHKSRRRGRPEELQAGIPPEPDET